MNSKHTVQVEPLHAFEWNVSHEWRDSIDPEAMTTRSADLITTILSAGNMSQHIFNVLASLEIMKQGFHTPFPVWSLARCPTVSLTDKKGVSNVVGNQKLNISQEFEKLDAIG